MSTAANEAVDTAVGSSDDEYYFLRKRRQARPLIEGLNLTAMMDIMTIILVYLIKLYSAAPENIPLSDDLRPPASTSPDNIVPAVSVMISRSAILVDNKPVLEVKDGKVVATDPKAAYAPLSTALAGRVDTIKAIAERGGSPFDGNLMVIADEDTPYDLVSSVLYQAGKSQFTTYRLIVRHK